MLSAYGMLVFLITNDIWLQFCIVQTPSFDFNHFPISFERLLPHLHLLWKQLSEMLVSLHSMNQSKLGKLNNNFYILSLKTSCVLPLSGILWNCLSIFLLSIHLQNILFKAQPNLNWVCVCSKPFLESIRNVLCKAPLDNKKSFRYILFNVLKNVKFTGIKCKHCIGTASLLWTQISDSSIIIHFIGLQELAAFKLFNNHIHISLYSFILSCT